MTLLLHWFRMIPYAGRWRALLTIYIIGMSCWVFDCMTKRIFYPHQTPASDGLSRISSGRGTTQISRRHITMRVVSIGICRTVHGLWSISSGRQIVLRMVRWIRCCSGIATPNCAESITMCRTMRTRFGLPNKSVRWQKSSESWMISLSFIR